jgi:hypothetical protein
VIGERLIGSIQMGSIHCPALRIENKPSPFVRVNDGKALSEQIMAPIDIKWPNMNFPVVYIVQSQANVLGIKLPGLFYCVYFSLWNGLSRWGVEGRLGIWRRHVLMACSVRKNTV